VSVFPHPLGCVLWFDFGEPKGDTAYDLSGMGNNGTIYGAARVVGPLSGALSFDGVDDYVEAPDSPPLDVDYITAELLLNPADPTAYKSFVSKGCIGVPPNRTWEITIRVGNYLRFCFSRDGSELLSAIYETPLVAGRWYHIVGLYDGEAGKLYVDGDLKATKPAPGTLFKNDYSLRLGLSHFGEAADATIALARIYNRALTEEEIRAHYNYARSAIVPEV